MQESKCRSTENGPIEFMGQQFSKTQPYSLACNVHEKIKTCIKVIDNAPATVQQKLLMISAVEVSKANYAPLVEQPFDKQVSKELYQDIDTDIANQIKRLFNLPISTDDTLKFITDSRLHGGLEIVLPGVYYENLV